jgi:hypothetical protein
LPTVKRKDLPFDYGIKHVVFNVFASSHVNCPGSCAFPWPYVDYILDGRKEMRRLAGIIGMAGIFGIMATGTVLAGTSDPVIQQREANQEQRIDQGIKSGQLTPGEAGRLEAQQTRIRQREARMKADGHLTAGERERLTRQQNRASRNIYRLKHNSRTAGI